MNRFLFDASVLVKRFAVEPGSSLIHHVFARVPRDRLMVLMLGAAEVAATLVRKRNGALLAAPAYSAAMLQLRSEILDAADFRKLPADNALIQSAISLCDIHAINATDATVLRTALDLAAVLRSTGDNLVLLACDQRLLRAATIEGVLTFDPERQPQAALDALI